MAMSNYERVGKSLELLKSGIAPFVQREVIARLSAVDARNIVEDFVEPDRKLAGKGILEWDVAALLTFMSLKWNDVFSRTLGPAERSLVNELREHRNSWAHQGTFSSDDSYRALDSAFRMLTAVSAPESEEIEKMKNELLRLRYDEQVRSEKRKGTGSTIESAVTGAFGALPWCWVMTFHHSSVFRLTVIKAVVCFYAYDCVARIPG